MEEKFREFFRDKTYIKIKNSLFNYKNRKEQIKKYFLKFTDLNKLKQNDFSIMDIGSGISPVSPLPKKTVYIDISPESAEIMSSWGYKAEVGNINKLKFRNNNFDVILCSEVLEHIKDYKKALKELHRVLKKEGKIIITVPVHQRYWNVDDEFVEHYRRFEPEQLETDLRDKGFTILLSKPIGSLVERKFTLAIVKNFIKNKNKNKRINKFKFHSIMFANFILYIILKISLLFTSRESTSIMMYVAEKN